MRRNGTRTGANQSVSGHRYLAGTLRAFAVVAMLAVLVTAIAHPAWSNHLPTAGPATAVVHPSFSDHRPTAASPGLIKGMQTVTVGGIGRTYRYIVPSRPAGRLPLLVVLHGRGQSEPAVVDQTGFSALVEQRGVVLVFPDGEQRSWNAGHGCCGVAASRGAPDVAFVAATVADAEYRWPVDVGRVYLVGYSNGGKLAYSEVCAHPTLFAAVATYGAVPLSPCHVGTASVPVLLAAGAADRVLPFGGKSNGHPPLPAVPQAVDWLRTQDGCQATAQTERDGSAVVQRWTDCAGGADVESVVYPDWGHAWPAGRSSEGSPAVATLMWSFLSRHDVQMVHPAATAAVLSRSRASSCPSETASGTIPKYSAVC